MTENDSGEDRDTLEPDEELDEIDIVYTKADDYRVVPATGTRGGIQAQGNFQIDFTIDYNQDPEYETYGVTDTGLGDVIHREGEPRIIRESQIGVNVSQREALSIGCWMIASLLGPDVTEEEITELIHDQYQERFSEQGTKD